jgi:hypothetical protein
MSTRALIEFYDLEKEKPTAVVYRHHDGDPGELGRDLLGFIDEIRDNFNDVGGMRLGLSQLDDASSLATRWIVYDAIRQLKHSEDYRKFSLEEIPKLPNVHKMGMDDETFKKYLEQQSIDNRDFLHQDHYLGFTGIGILRDPADRTDIEYNYRVICDGNPTILCGDKKLEEMVGPRKVEGGLIMFQ